MRYCFCITAAFSFRTFYQVITDFKKHQQSQNEFSSAHNKPKPERDAAGLITGQMKRQAFMHFAIRSAVAADNENPPLSLMHGGKQRGGLGHADGKLGSDSQFLAAAAATSRENATAVFRGHTGAETMNLAALALLRMKSWTHTSTLL